MVWYETAVAAGDKRTEPAWQGGAGSAEGWKQIGLFRRSRYFGRLRSTEGAAIGAT